MEERTRRNALQRGLVVLGGLVGLGAGAAARAGRGVVTAEAPPGASMTLQVRDLRGPGRLPGRNEAATARADLFDPAGRRVGELHVASLPMTGPGVAAPDTGVMEWHTFHLDGGTIIGTGSAGTERGSFAVVGGTGRFANARGTYDLLRGGAMEDGAAEFVLRLEAPGTLG